MVSSGALWLRSPGFDSGCLQYFYEEPAILIFSMSEQSDEVFNGEKKTPSFGCFRHFQAKTAKLNKQIKLNRPNYDLGAKANFVERSSISKFLILISWAFVKTKLNFVEQFADGLI